LKKIIKFQENPFSGSRVVSCGRTQTDKQTDRHDEANSHFLGSWFITSL